MQFNSKKTVWTIIILIFVIAGIVMDFFSSYIHIRYGFLSTQSVSLLKPVLILTSAAIIITFMFLLFNPYRLTNKTRLSVGSIPLLIAIMIIGMLYILTHNINLF